MVKKLSKLECALGILLGILFIICGVEQQLMLSGSDQCAKFISSEFLKFFAPYALVIIALELVIISDVIKQSIKKKKELKVNKIGDKSAVE